MQQRAEKRRNARELRRAEQYAKSGHEYQLKRVEFVQQKRHKPYTQKQLLERAIARMDKQWSMFEGLRLSNKAPHANRPTPQRNVKPFYKQRKAKLRELFLKGLEKVQPKKYMHRVARAAA